MAWNPWRALRARPHIVFRLAELPHATGGAVYWPRPPRAAIIIDPALPRRERRAALAHELVHDERGGGADHPGMPAEWAPVVARDETSVDREVASRLVPADELLELCERLADQGGGVLLDDVAEHFDVPAYVAAVAVLSLPATTRGGCVTCARGKSC